MKKRVYDFNQKRNQFSWDADLEKAMFDEEVKEFFDATTLAERVDALCDCRYVKEGTVMKMTANGIATMPYNDGAIYVMEEILVSEINGADYMYEDNMVCGSRSKYNNIMAKAMKIVCDCNELKVTHLDANGKVAKPKGSVPDATKIIEVMIAQVLENY